MHHTPPQCRTLVGWALLGTSCSFSEISSFPPCMLRLSKHKHLGAVPAIEAVVDDRQGAWFCPTCCARQIASAQAAAYAPQRVLSVKTSAQAQRALMSGRPNTNVRRPTATG